MLATLLLSGLLQGAPQTPPPAATPHPQTPQQIEGRRSAFVQGTLNVAVGERATLRRNADGTYDLIAVDAIRVEDVLPPRDGSPAGELNGAAPGTLRFGLHGRQDVGSLLKVENGQDTGLKYGGFVVRYLGGRARGPEATSVCTVPAGMTTFEHWPEPVIQIVVGGLEPSADTVPTCPPHAAPASPAEAPTNETPSDEAPSAR